MITLLTCWLKGHVWHYHSAWFRFCRRCGVEQVWATPNSAKPADRWRTHREECDERRSLISGLCGNARTAYETDRDTLAKVFSVYFKACAATGDVFTARGLTPEELVKKVMLTEEL